MKERRIVDIDRDNFNEVLKQSKPQVNLAEVDNLLAGTGKLAGSVLVFEALADFEPINVVRKVDVLNAVFESHAQRQVQGDGSDLARAVLSGVAHGNQRIVGRIPRSRVGMHMTLN
jgi:type VI secretion system protein ImpC